MFPPAFAINSMMIPKAPPYGKRRSYAFWSPFYIASELFVHFYVNPSRQSL